MLNFIIQRLLSGIGVLFFISIITFVVLMWIPGNPALLSLGTDATPEKVEALKESMGLHVPWYEQYINWLIGFLSGDWGTSYVFGEEILILITQRLPVTLSLAALSLTIAIPFAVMFGVISALYQNKWIDYMARSLMQLGDAVPQFWLALLFLVFFAAGYGWFPVAGFTPMEEGFWVSVHSILLPSIVLAIGQVGPLIRIIRSSMLSSLEQDYMLMTRVNGLSRTRAIGKYALRGAIIAPLTIVGMQLAGILGGAVLVESIFALPGIGRLLLMAVEQRDLILLQGVVFFITSAVVIVNIITDILYRLVNPMIRFGGNHE
ncbi:ABC transporter permease [Oceanobacillus salinisoli]|uniref:ABC transporter permease n=1 Tax=Oceanobacillus salinisoli TaxID=2678611 RepID=UPI0012E195A8|nr:ABC transporter permease [Oceanobacillus salinisoli]